MKYFLRRVWILEKKEDKFGQMKIINLTVCLLLFTLLLIIPGTVSCKKNDVLNDKTLIGKWISSDMADTLEFTTDRDLYKNINGKEDHYDYSFSGDSILISYSGVAMPYIYLLPAKNRFFQLNSVGLTIDFRSAYYGFGKGIILFHRR
jgi:hypothetical protein